MCLFQKIEQPVARCLQYGDPRSVRNYKTLLESMLDEADIVTDIINFETTVSIPLSDRSMKSHEELNLIITKCMLQAENKCRKLYIV